MAWLTLPFLFLLFAADDTLRHLDLLSFPATPISHVHPRFGEQWQFLWHARHAILPGETYEIHAENRFDELNLYVFSIGLCARRVPVFPPRYGALQSHRRARFFVAWNDFTEGEKDLRFVVRFPGGVVYERIGGAAR